MGDAVVHRGPLEGGELGRIACFAGTGPGEVSVAGAKVVGISQRRTRLGSLFHTAALTRFDPERLAGFLSFDPLSRHRLVGALSTRVAASRIPVPELEAAFLSHLPD